jgi:hypothetical protein
MSDLQEIIAKQAVLAFNQGFETGQKNGYKHATRDIFDEVKAALDNICEDYSTQRIAQEALWEAIAKVEALQERYLPESK